MLRLHSRNFLQPSKKRRTSMPASSELLPGLPDDLALLCLARVPSLALLWRVSASWQAIVSQSAYFHSLRSSLGFKTQQWLYALLHNPSTAQGRDAPPSREDGSAPAFSWHTYDPISNSWQSLPPLPHPVDFHLSSPSFIGLLHSVQCVSTATKIFMVAGSRLDKCGVNEHKRQTIEPALECPLIFDTQTREWSEGAPFNVPRKWCVCGTVADKLLVASGCGREWDMALSKSAQMYDSDARRWVEVEGLRSSTFSRMGMSAVNYKGKLHIVSGVGVVYDPETGKWGDMPRGMKDGWSGQSLVVDGELYVLEESTGRLKVYEEGRDEWRFVTMQDEMLKNMEQLAGGPTSGGMFCGVVRARPTDSEVQQEDAIRIVDIRGGRLRRTMDLRLPFGRIVALQVLSRTFL